MNCGVEHHRPGQRHDCLNSALGGSVVVMSACASKTDDLGELAKLVCKPT
jgi:hypothetical protein